jgi:hypothetical protein
MTTIFGLFLTACGVGISTDDSARPGLNESSITGEARETSQSPTTLPTPEKTPTLEPTPTQMPEPTVDPEVLLEQELQFKANEAVNWAEREGLQKVAYADLKEYMPKLLAAEEAVGRERLSLIWAGTGEMQGHPDYARLYLGTVTGDREIWARDGNRLNDNPIQSLTLIEMPNGEIVYLLGFAVQRVLEGGKVEDQANIHVIVSDVATGEYINGIARDKNEVLRLQSLMMMEDIMARIKAEKENASLEVWPYIEGAQDDPNYQTMVVDRGFEELYLLMVEADANELVRKLFAGERHLTDEEKELLQRLILVAGRVLMHQVEE